MTHKNYVFVIDEDSSSRNGLLRLLSSGGFYAQGFASVNEFLDTVNPEEQGCILLDGGIPGMSSEELIVQLKKRKLHYPIIFITSDDNVEIQKIAKELKAIGLFRKPVDGIALLDSIRWATGSVHSNQNNLNQDK